MANNCDYNMRVRGAKENVYEFHKRMRDYDSPNHLFGMFDADIYDEFQNEDGTTTIDICGQCAWSIESCCRASGYSNGIDLFEVNTRELGLKLECWSNEEGMCFQEHYLYDNGEIINIGDELNSQDVKKLKLTLLYNGETLPQNTVDISGGVGNININYE